MNKITIFAKLTLNFTFKPLFSDYRHWDRFDIRNCFRYKNIFR